MTTSGDKAKGHFIKYAMRTQSRVARDWSAKCELNSKTCLGLMTNMSYEGETHRTLQCLKMVSWDTSWISGAWCKCPDAGIHVNVCVVARTLRERREKNGRKERTGEERSEEWSE